MVFALALSVLAMDMVAGVFNMIGEVVSWQIKFSSIKNKCLDYKIN